jgi:hypothetical protein
MAPAGEDADRAEEARAGRASPTNPPIREDDRVVTREREAALLRPFPWVALGGVIVLVAVAAVAVLSAGGRYAIPFAVLTLILAVFVGTHRVLGWMQTRRHETGRAEEKAAADSGDPIPHLGFDEQSQLGATAQSSAEEDQAHTDMERSTGQG